MVHYNAQMNCSRTYRTKASIGANNSAILLILKVVLLNVIPKGLDDSYPRILLDTKNVTCGSKFC